MTLKAIALDAPELRIEGALEVQKSPDKIIVCRLPDWTRAQSPEPAFDLMAAMTSGVRLSLATDSERIELDFLATGLQFEGEDRRPIVFDVYVNGTLFARESIRSGHTVRVDDRSVGFTVGEANTLRLCDLGAGRKHICIYLPQSAMTEVLGLRLPVAASLFDQNDTRRHWGHYGSSISHGMDADGPSETWPAMVARQLGLNLTNLGFAGQCHLDGFVARTLRDGPFDLISLKLGANIVASDSMRQRTFASAVHALLDTIRDGKPNVPILLISPIYCPLIDDMPGPVKRLEGGAYLRLPRQAAIEDGALCLSAVRTQLKAIFERRRGAGDKNLHYLDGLGLFSAADLAMMPDQLHPNADGHRLMAQRFGQSRPDDFGGFADQALAPT